MENKVSALISSFFIPFMYKVTLIDFANVFEEFYIFAVTMGPIRMSFLAPYI